MSEHFLYPQLDLFLQDDDAAERCFVLTGSLGCHDSHVRVASGDWSAPGALWLLHVASLGYGGPKSLKSNLEARAINKDRP